MKVHETNLLEGAVLLVAFTGAGRTFAASIVMDLEKPVPLSAPASGWR
jgi:hypothetical protein